MSLANRIPEPIELASPASFERIQDLASKLALELPVQYQELLSEADGVNADDVQIYSCDAVPERNETYEVSIFAPGYILVGSVSGFPVLLRSGAKSPIYQGAWGLMNPSYFVLLATSLAEWIDSGCPDRDDI